jgi:pimeloyl-ACP methyl ester carboxylesterase
MEEQFCEVGDGITLCYETFGAADDPPLLLVMGLGTQMVAWPEPFCRELAGRGFQVIRFDNRDIGRSTWMNGRRAPAVGELLRRRIVDPPYTLSDLARDTAGLIEALDLHSAHVVGASMGGMIAQMLAVEHPEVVRSLTSIMSNTGHRFRGQPAVGIYPLLLRRAPTEREAFVAHMMRVFEAIGSRRLGRDFERLRATAELSFERGVNPAGSARQLGAIVASGDRTAALGTIEAPTLVIHGRRDPMVRPSGGRATARAIPGARLLMIDDMGHDLPEQAWPQLIDAIADHAHAAETAPGRRATLS